MEMIPNADGVAVAILAAAREIECANSGDLALRVASGDRDKQDGRTVFPIAWARAYAALALREVYGLGSLRIGRLVGSRSPNAYFSMVKHRAQSSAWYDPEAFRRVVEATHEAKVSDLAPEPGLPETAPNRPATPGRPLPEPSDYRPTPGQTHFSAPGPQKALVLEVPAVLDVPAFLPPRPQHGQDGSSRMKEPVPYAGKEPKSRLWGINKPCPPSARGVPFEDLNGYRHDCEKCGRPFRCFRADEPICGCCKPSRGG